MADISFPTGIVRLSKEPPAPNVRRTEFESGDIKQSRMSQVQRVVQDVTIVFTHAQYLTFKNWFRYQALDGSQFFNAADPVDGTTRDYRIVGGVIDPVPNTHMSHWFVTMQWEYFPPWDPPEA